MEKKKSLKLGYFYDDWAGLGSDWATSGNWLSVSYVRKELVHTMCCLTIRRQKKGKKFIPVHLQQPLSKGC